MGFLLFSGKVAFLVISCLFWSFLAFQGVTKVVSMGFFRSFPEMSLFSVIPSFLLSFCLSRSHQGDFYGLFDHFLRKSEMVRKAVTTDF